MNFIGALEQALGIKAIKEFLPMQPGDVLATSADTRELEAWVGFQPSTSVTDGVVNFVKWYRGFYNVIGTVKGQFLMLVGKNHRATGRCGTICSA